MKYLILIAGLFFIFQPVFAQKEMLFEETTWEQALQKAKNENKLLFIDISKKDCFVCEQNLKSIQTNDNLTEFHNSNFINYRILPNNDKYSYLVKRYNISSYPSYLYIKPDGVLVHIGSKALTADEFVHNAQLAMEYKNEAKPIAQWNLDYVSKTQDKKFVFDYIEKCTVLGHDNADAIDQYTLLAKDEDILKTPVISLFLLKNEKLNANGPFFSFVLDNKDKIKSQLKLSDIQFNEKVLNSVEHTFSKACEFKNETLLDIAIKAKLAYLKADTEEERNVVANGYKATFYYNTKQPALLANYVTLYANTLMEQGHDIDKAEEETDTVIETTPNINTKALFPSNFSAEILDAQRNEEIDIAYSFKLRDAAQYVVEMISNKRMLNNALVWSQKAIELFDNFRNYETQAYILYKLGKRSEAIASMEKAYEFAPITEDLVKEKVEAKLIMMKRGERIF